MFVSSLAGGAVAFAGTAIWVLVVGRQSERNWGEAMKAASFVGFWAFLVCVCYALVLGLVVYLYLRARPTQIGLHVAMIAGLLGAVPFILPIFKKSFGTSQMWFIPVLAVLCANATAWVFWKIALAPVSASSSQN